MIRVGEFQWTKKRRKEAKQNSVLEDIRTHAFYM